MKRPKNHRYTEEQIEYLTEICKFRKDEEITTFLSQMELIK